MVVGAVAIAVGGIIVGLIVALLIFAVGVYVFRAPVPIVGLIAFLIFLLFVLGNFSAY